MPSISRPLTPRRQSSWAILIVVLVVAVAGFAPVGVAALEDDDYDDRLHSSETFWAGQTLSFDGSRIVPNAGNADRAERTFQIRRVTTDERVAGLVTEFVVDQDGIHLIDTDRLDGLFVIIYDGTPVSVHDGVGYTADPPNGAAVTVTSSEWEVAVQDLSADWSDDRIHRHDPLDLELRSNRATFRVEISATGLDFDELEELFSSRDFADNYDIEADDDVIVLDAGAETDLRVDFGEVDDGLYTFIIEVTDTTATATVEARVGRVQEEPPTEPPPPREPTSTVSSTLEPTPKPTPKPTPTTTVGTTPPPPTTISTTTASRTPTPTPTATPTPTPTTATSSPTPTNSPGQSGFGLLVTSIVILLLTAIARRRSS